MGGSAPKQDPNMGIAARMSAETGQQMLSWMQGQADITNQWAAEDRARDINTFRPLQDQFIAEAQTWDSPERVASQAAMASADVQNAAKVQRETAVRQATAMGVNPNSGRFINAQAKAGTDTALAMAGASNLSRRQVQAEGDARRAQAINMGSGFAVNPATSMEISNGAAQSGFSGAMRGYGQQASILNQDYNNRFSAWQSGQQSLGGLFSGLGAVAGALPWSTMLSTKDAKHEKKPSKGNLEAVKKMPVEEWTYKPGMGDGGRHVGPYAEDFKAATGKGDGKSIPIQDMMGVTMGAVQELGAKVDQIAAKIDGAPKGRRTAPPRAMGAMRVAA